MMAPGAHSHYDPHRIGISAWLEMFARTSPGERGIGGLEQLSGSLLLAGRDGRVDDLALSRLRSPAVFCSIPDSGRDPVMAGEAEFGLAHVLQHAAGLLDDASRSQVAITAGHQDLAQAQRRCPDQD
jgi:hypothetical protein